MNHVLEVAAKHRRGIRPAEGVVPAVAGVEHSPAVAAPPRAARTTPARARRLVNVVAATAALVLLLPLMLIIGVLIKLTSPGPMIYRQTRVGIDRRGPLDPRRDGRRKVDYGGKLFTIYKFRTMSVSTNRTLQIWAKPNDARVTPLGRVLRRYRLDELPQLINVLKGDMNLVGPRPEQPSIFMALRDSVDQYGERQRVLPGITGSAQINHHYDRCIEDVRKKLWYDLEYIHRAGIWHDLSIIFRTVPVILFRRGGW